jgi:hypothetical protein
VSTVILEHRPEIQAALEAHENSFQALRAALALARLLEGAYAAGETPAAWSHSRLTGGGYPVEFTYTTADRSLRYTVDPAPPGSPLAGRLISTAALLEQLGSPPLEPHLLELLSDCQGNGDLDYGAWLGGRHGPSGDRYKLYAELPPAGADCLAELIHTVMVSPPRLPDRQIQLRMLGCEPAANRIELYYRVDRLEIDHLPHLLKPAGLTERAGELLAWIEAAYGHPLRGKLPGGSVGFSYALSYPAEQPQVPGAFTVFLFARALWGGDARIRLRFADHARSMGREARGYLLATAPLASRDVYQTYHGLLGISLSQDASLHLSLGVRPPLPETNPTNLNNAA